MRAGILASRPGFDGLVVTPCPRLQTALAMQAPPA